MLLIFNISDFQFGFSSIYNYGADEAPHLGNEIAAFKKCFLNFSIFIIAKKTYLLYDFISQQIFYFNIFEFPKSIFKNKKTRPEKILARNYLIINYWETKLLPTQL